MSDKFTTMAARLQRAVPNAEAQVDDSLIALSSLERVILKRKRIRYCADNLRIRQERIGRVGRRCTSMLPQRCAFLLCAANA